MQRFHKKILVQVIVEKYILREIVYMLKLGSYESLMLGHIYTDTKAYSGLKPNTYINWSVVSVEEIKEAIWR